MKLSTNFHEKITFLGKITFIGYFSPISGIIRQNFNEKMPIDNFSEKQPLTNLLPSNFFGTVPRPFSNQVTKTYTFFIYFINTCSVYTFLINWGCSVFTTDTISHRIFPRTERNFMQRTERHFL